MFWDNLFSFQIYYIFYSNQLNINLLFINYEKSILPPFNSIKISCIIIILCRTLIKNKIKFKRLKKQKEKKKKIK